MALEPVRVSSRSTLIGWKRLAHSGHDFLQLLGVLCQLSREEHVQKIEAVPQLNHCPDDGWVFDVAAFTLCLLLRPFQSTRRSVFPKVNATAEPVVGVVAGLERGFSRKHGIGHAPVAAVESENCALVGEEVHFALTASRLADRKAIPSRGFIFSTMKAGHRRRRCGHDWRGRRSQRWHRIRR